MSARLRGDVMTPPLPARLEHVLIQCMDYGLVLFTSDRGITPAAAAKLADDHGFQTFYVPEHTHIPVKREAAHPTTGDESLPDDRYMRTLDPWVSLGAVGAGTLRVRLEYRRTRRPWRTRRAASHHASRVPGGDAGVVDPRGSVLPRRIRQLRT